MASRIPPQIGAFTLARLRQMAEPTVGAWCRRYSIEDAATANDLREAIASYGEMLIQHHLGAQLVTDSAEILSTERSTSSGPRDKASSSSSDGRPAALDAAPSMTVEAEDQLRALCVSAGWEDEGSTLGLVAGVVEALKYERARNAALARSAPAETPEKAKNDDDDHARVDSQ